MGREASVFPTDLSWRKISLILHRSLRIQHLPSCQGHKQLLKVPPWWRLYSLCGLFGPTTQTRPGSDCPSLQTLCSRAGSYSHSSVSSSPSLLCCFHPRLNLWPLLHAQARPLTSWERRPATSYHPNQKSFIKRYFIIEDHNINCSHWHSSAKLVRYFPAPLLVLTSTLGVERVGFSHLPMEKLKCLGVKHLAQKTDWD